MPNMSGRLLRLHRHDLENLSLTTQSFGHKSPSIYWSPLDEHEDRSFGLRTSCMVLGLCAILTLMCSPSSPSGRPLEAWTEGSLLTLYPQSSYVPTQQARVGYHACLPYTQ